MDLIVFIVGSIAALACGWFALQILFRLVLSIIKIGALAGLAYFAAQLTWINAEIPEVVSADAAALVELFDRQFEGVTMPKLNVQVRWPEQLPSTNLSEVNFGGEKPKQQEALSKGRYF